MPGGICDNLPGIPFRPISHIPSIFQDFQVLPLLLTHQHAAGSQLDGRPRHAVFLCFR